MSGKEDRGCPQGSNVWESGAISESMPWISVQRIALPNLTHVTKPRTHDCNLSVIRFQSNPHESLLVTVHIVRRRWLIPVQIPTHRRNHPSRGFRFEKSEKVVLLTQDLGQGKLT